MGDTHFRSNIKGQAGTETITEFATMGDDSTAMECTTMKVGTNSYIFGSTYATAASILAEGVAIDAAISSSFALGSGAMFYIEAAATIFQVNATALT